jgi:hypothetical protein
VIDAALNDAVELRFREHGKLEGCIEPTRVVHDVDRSPLVLPADIADFLASPRLIVAWVADGGGRISDPLRRSEAADGSHRRFARRGSADSCSALRLMRPPGEA